MGSARSDPFRDGGEGDSAGGPRAERGDAVWPTLVIEDGDPETLNDLRNDLEWWFDASNHQVKIVLLAKFDHNRNQIILEKWVEVHTPPRQGATTTSQSSTPYRRRAMRHLITFIGLTLPYSPAKERAQPRHPRADRHSVCIKQHFTGQTVSFLPGKRNQEDALYLEE